MRDDDDSFHVEMISRPDHTLSVALSGELDMADAHWVEATLAVAAEHHRALDVDLSRIRFVDSTGIRTLITLKQRASILRIDVTFRDLSPAVSRALEAAGQLSILD